MYEQWSWRPIECTCGRGMNATVHDRRCYLWIALGLPRSTGR